MSANELRASRGFSTSPRPRVRVGRERAIVKSPSSYSREIIDLSFSLAKVSEGLGSQDGEDERASYGHVPHHSH